MMKTSLQCTITKLQKSKKRYKQSISTFNIYSSPQSSVLLRKKFSTKLIYSPSLLICFARIFITLCKKILDMIISSINHTYILGTIQQHTIQTAKISLKCKPQFRQLRKNISRTVVDAAHDLVDIITQFILLKLHAYCYFAMFLKELQNMTLKFILFEDVVQSHSYLITILKTHTFIYDCEIENYTKLTSSLKNFRQAILYIYYYNLQKLNAVTIRTRQTQPNTYRLIDRYIYYYNLQKLNAVTIRTRQTQPNTYRFIGRYYKRSCVTYNNDHNKWEKNQNGYQHAYYITKDQKPIACYYQISMSIQIAIQLRILQKIQSPFCKHLIEKYILSQTTTQYVEGTINGRHIIYVCKVYQRATFSFINLITSAPPMA
eukprot:TRINITY_DN16268_c0_g2_i1.p1 TRINITY_DN16268_c0_g2~~TRINITY_DN16268_c0_g2_i1.p1  ORF type:complete len:374 (+),score=-34.90 TRINITY_DN16268_c0_g2_i1:488-1609(+)